MASIVHIIIPDCFSDFRKKWPVQPKSPKILKSSAQKCPKDLPNQNWSQSSTALPFGTKTNPPKKRKKLRWRPEPPPRKKNFFFSKYSLPTNQPTNQPRTKVFKNLVSNCSTYFGYSEELAVPWPLQKRGGLVVFPVGLTWRKKLVGIDRWPTVGSPWFQRKFEVGVDW